MKNKKNILFIVIILIILTGIYIGYRKFASASLESSGGPAATVSVKYVSSTITADGSVTAQNQATLSFQTPGKLIYLPFKEGDTVYAGQTIAQLDTYELQRQLEAALSNYRSQRDAFDQTQQNTQDNVLRAQQLPGFLQSNISNSDAVNEAIERIADQNQNNLDNSVVNVELANYALQLSTLASPLDGIIIQEGVTVPGINITPATTFTVADPSTMVFRANVPTEDIYYVHEGSPVLIAIDGIQNKIEGSVVKIYPSEVVSPSGEEVYQVDIQSDGLKKYAQLDQTGTAIISTNAENVALVPAWTVLSGKYIWVDDNGTPVLRQVKSGAIHGNQVEITGGLSSNDKIIIDPKYIPSLEYQML